MPESYVVVGHLYTVCAVTVRYTVRCGQCPDVAVEEMRLLPGEGVAWGTLPTGWWVVNGQPFCARHTVEVHR